MISNEIHQLLNKQINAELWSAYYYLSMSLDAQHKGNSGSAHWFLTQSNEEVTHARIIQNYLNARDAKVELMAIAPVTITWNSPLAMFEDALKHEKVVTSMINDIMKKAQMQNDYATQSFLNWFVDEQVEEEENCNSIIQQIKNAADNQCTLYQIEKELKKRKNEGIHHMRGENWIA